MHGNKVPIDYAVDTVLFILYLHTPVKSDVVKWPKER